MAKKKSIESVEEKSEAVASESPVEQKAGGSWKAAMNVMVGKGVQLKTGDDVPSDLSSEEIEALIKDKMIVKG